MDLSARLQADGIVCEDVWTPDFSKHLYMNASMAYKVIANYDMAIHYARKYLELQDGSPPHGEWDLVVGFRCSVRFHEKRNFCSTVYEADVTSNDYKPPSQHWITAAQC